MPEFAVGLKNSCLMGNAEDSDSKLGSMP
jgi:hypothetical protein